MIHLKWNTISQNQIQRAEKVLQDNGFTGNEVAIVLQAVGYALLDVELYPEKSSAASC